MHHLIYFQTFVKGTIPGLEILDSDLLPSFEDENEDPDRHEVVNKPD